MGFLKVAPGDTGRLNASIERMAWRCRKGSTRDPSVAVFRSAVPPFRRQARVASGILIPGGRLVALWVSLLPRIKLAP